MRLHIASPSIPRYAMCAVGRMICRSADMVAMAMEYDPHLSSYTRWEGVGPDPGYSGSRSSFFLNHVSSVHGPHGFRERLGRCGYFYDVGCSCRCALRLLLNSGAASRFRRCCPLPLYSYATYNSSCLTASVSRRK